jgi:hypothetical protein
VIGPKIRLFDMIFLYMMETFHNKKFVKVSNLNNRIRIKMDARKEEWKGKIQLHPSY